MRKLYKLCAFWVHTKINANIFQQIVLLSPSLSLRRKLMTSPLNKASPRSWTIINIFCENTQLWAQNPKLGIFQGKILDERQGKKLGEDIIWTLKLLPAFFLCFYVSYLVHKPFVWHLFTESWQKKSSIQGNFDTPNFPTKNWNDRNLSKLRKIQTSKIMVNFKQVLKI